MRRPTLAVASLAVLVVACTGGTVTTSDDSVAPVTTSASDAAPSSEATAGSTIASGASDDLDTQIEWFVRAANGALVDEAVYEERFVEGFRRAVSFEEFESGLASLTEVPGDWLIVNVDRETDARGSVLVVAGDEQARISIEVDPADGGRIGGLLIQPANLPSTPADFEEAYALIESEGTARMLVASVDGTTCQPSFERKADEPAPLGSVFKLYVLGALANAIEAGDVSWDDEIIIRDELKSIPSGILQDEPDGTVRSVEEVAALMISISDNTATDHLIDYLGRETIEAQLSALGASDPSLNTPFLTTRELAALKVGPASGLRDRYLAADEDGRRDILDQISDISVADLPVEDLRDPVDPHRLEWFASPNDICTLMAMLWDMGTEPGLEPIRRILVENPGIAAETGLWEQVAFKGGSEPGLAVVAWLTETAAGERFFVTGSVVNETEAIDELAVILALAEARDLQVPSP